MKQAADAYPSKLHDAVEFLRANDRYLVVSHVNPDGDAASSTFAIGKILEYLGKTYEMANEGEIPSKFSWLWGYSKVRNHTLSPIVGRFDYIIMADCADFGRAGHVSGAFSSSAHILNIDHHPTNDRFGDLALVNDHAAATAEVLYDLIETAEIPWDRELAECIYTGLLTDTGGFRYSNTSPKVMHIASKLLEYGVNGPQIAERLLETMSLGQIKLLKRALASLAFDPTNQIAWMSLGLKDMQESGAKNDDADGLVNYAINVEGVEVGLLFKEAEQGLLKVSFRSSGRVDVSQIAKEFGGGGHVRASGCSLKEKDLAAGIDRVIARVGKALA